MQGSSSGRSKVRSALRQATAAIHDRLHQAPAFVAIADQQLDIAGYTELLARIASFHLTVGQYSESGNLRAQLLARDLKVLGSPAPECRHWSFPRTRLGNLGLTYVVEGSSLGGKVIYQQLDYLFGNSAAGRRFFRGSTSDGLRWQALCRRLEEEGQTPFAVHEMISGATAAFALFEQTVVRGEPA